MGEKPEPGPRPVAGAEEYGQLEDKILKVLMDNDCDFTSVTHARIASDIRKLGWENVCRMARSFSPSQLGRMGYLGVRWLAKIRRDDPAKFERVVRELEGVVAEVEEVSVNE